MRRLVAVTLFLSATALYAQTGHWEGSIQAPGKDVKIEVDLAMKDGKLAGTFANPAQNESGFPLSDVSAKETSVTFAIKATNGGGTFQGTLSADGKSMSGDFISAHGMSIPFSLTRTGEAKIQAPRTSRPIPKVLEGSWTGTIEANGQQIKIGLKMANHPDATSTGSVITAEGVEIAISKITSEGSSLKLDVKNVGGSYVGKLNEVETELVGTWTQGPFVAPLTFRREK